MPKGKDKDGNPVLTLKEQRFCRAWVDSGNATKSALSAGYSPKTAYQTGCENLKKPHIKGFIKELLEDIESIVGINKAMIVAKHKEFAFTDFTDILETWFTRKEFEELPANVKSCISEVITEVRTEYVGRGENRHEITTEYVKIKLYDKQKSLDSISDLMSYKAAIKQEISGKDGKEFKGFGFFHDKPATKRTKGK